MSNSDTTPAQEGKISEGDAYIHLRPAFADLSSMCELAIERGDIGLLQMLIEDDEAAVAEWRKWRANTASR